MGFLKAISLDSNPLINNILIKRRYAVSRCGAMIVADMNQLTLEGLGRDEEGIMGGELSERMTVGGWGGYLGVQSGKGAHPQAS